MEERLHLAEQFLQEAVYLSRARQAAGVSLVQGSGDTAGCGLGQHAEVVLELSPRAREIEPLLWPDGAQEPRRLREALAAWVEEQDRLDRKRNHYLREFRRRHGMDRRAYAPQVESEFAAGLARLDVEMDGARREAALRIL